MRWPDLTFPPINLWNVPNRETRQIMFEYEAKAVRVIDGDTIELDIDLGFSITRREKVRLYGVNTPELTDKDPAIRKKALEAKQAVINMVMGKTLQIKTLKDKLDKYGRILVIIHVNGFIVNDELVSANLAEPYFA